MAETFSLDTSAFEQLIPKLQEYGNGAEGVINSTFKANDEVFKNSIDNILPVSDRKKHAKGSNPFQSTFGNLSITIKSKKKYNYLYFPDDGSNTERHQGNQQFMRRGVELKQQTMIELILENLSKNF